nr:MAG: ORF1 [TTV-like mini virus]
MPFYPYKRRARYYRRRYWRRRRPRRPVYRRYWRRRPRVSRKFFKRKLKRLTIKEWQPESIKRLKIRGYYPLFMATNERLNHNMTTYLESIAPHYIPGGGGFSICQFSLQTLYQEHFKLHNWWTKSNDNYPLIRFLGCSLKLYRPEFIDYVFYYQRQYPMRATNLMYTSTQPQIMLLNNRTKIIKCKSNNRQQKPYKKLFIRPPSQMQNKWYFQKDIAQIPLLLTIASAASLDRTYTNSTSISSTIGFTTLNITAFGNHQFSKLPTAGYKPKETLYYFATQSTETDPKKVEIGSLTYLGNTEQYQAGKDIQAYIGNVNNNADTWRAKLKQYLSKPSEWGNPFHADYINNDLLIFYTNKNSTQLADSYSKSTDKLNTETTINFHLMTEKFHYEVRYNPFHDDHKNSVYLLKITEPNSFGWDPPTNPELILENLPLWACVWGYTDWQKKRAIYNSIDTNCIVVIVTHNVDPKTAVTLIPLDEDFLHQRSPYRPEHNIIPTDLQNWHPKVAFQLRTLNKIACTGPYTAKLPERISCEAHMQYTFHFKIGGSPPPMSTITSPENQPKFPTPGNIMQTTSLQSPTLPFEYNLYHFDQRRDQLTKRALTRIQTDFETEKTLLPITGATSTEVPAQKEETTSESETSEEETTIQQQLHKQRKQQRLLRHRIKQLLNRLTNM